MSRSKVDEIVEMYPEGTFTIADGFDDAIIGVDEQNGKIVYDIDAIIEILMAGGMEVDDAFDFYYYNIVGAYIGDSTPVFVRLIKK